MDYIEYMNKFKSEENLQTVKKFMVETIRNWFNVNGLGCKAVIGISGGKDSTIAAAFCVEALGKDRVFGVLMPNGIQSDIDDSLRVVKSLGIDYTIVNIKDSVDALKASICLETGSPIKQLSNQATINLPPRIRMSILYAVSQTVGGRVINTCNKSEDWVGYSTRYGDSAGDFSLFAEYTTDEVIALGDTFENIPNDLIHKTPSDGLCGKTDEDNLGFTYATLNEYIRTGVCEDEDTRMRIDLMHERNLFKLQLMPVIPFLGGH